MKSIEKGRYLRRYTELPFLIDYLNTGEIALLPPSSWDDRNDSHYLEQFQVSEKLKAIHAICLTETSETYHHWRIFSPGSSGVCILFHRTRFLAAARSHPDVYAEPVNYRTIDQLKKKRPTSVELPFLKRWAFSDEREYRVVHCSRKPHQPIYRIAMPTNLIARVMLSPWLPESVSDQVKVLIRSIPGCEKLTVNRSTLVSNERWKGFAAAE